MIELRPVDTVERIKPEARILLVNHWVRFSDAFPGDLDHVKGKTFRIVKQQQVHYPLSWILKEACYKDINLSNEDTGEKLYPNVGDNLYEVLIGFKPGNWFCIPYFPADQPIYRLDYSDMSPVISNAAHKYLAAIRPEDTPVENPVFKLYLVYNLKPVYLRLYADDGVDYEKVTLEFIINRCKLEQGTPPDHITPKPILYLDQIKM